MTSHLARQRWWPGLALAAVAPLLVVTGCGTEESPSLQDDPGEVVDDEGEIVGGAPLPEVTVNEDVEVIGVQLAYPLDGLYEAGEEVPLYAALTNTGATPVTLVDITGPNFDDAVSSGGSAEPDDALEIVVPPNDNTYVGAEGSPSVVLVGLDTDLRSSQSIPVTFVFEDAGEVTAEAVVSAEDGNPSSDFSFPDPAEDPSGE